MIKWRKNGKIMDFLAKFQFFGIFDFWQKFDFWINLDFYLNFDFCTKFRFLPKISIFARNFDFCQKFRFLPKISIFAEIIDFLAKILIFWTKISIFKIQILAKNVDFLQNSNFNFSIFLIFFSKFFFLKTYYGDWSKMKMSRILFSFLNFFLIFFTFFEKI